MKAWRDMATPPSDTQIAEFKAQGIWGIAGYFKFNRSGNVVVGNPIVGDNLYWGWADSDFQRVLAQGLSTLAFCSGLDDPSWVSSRAARLGIITCLDVESGIRPAGSWMQGWLNASGSGIYGNGPIHRDITAAFHIASGYLGVNPQSSWPSPGQWAAFGWGAYISKPTVAGWQWQGSHAEDGISVDSNWFDDAINDLHGGATGQINTEDDDMLYVGPIHPLAATLKTFGAGTIYSDPSTTARVVGSIANGASVAVKGYRYSTSPVQSSDLGPPTNAPGPDFVWWEVANGWVPDAPLITLGVAGAPTVFSIPAAEPMSLYFAVAGSGGGSAGPDDDSSFATKVYVDTQDAAVKASIPAPVDPSVIEAGVLQKISDAVKKALGL